MRLQMYEITFAGQTGPSRIASYAERAGCEFRLASPRLSLVKVMRITGLDRRFLASQATCRLVLE